MLHLNKSIISEDKKDRLSNSYEISYNIIIRIENCMIESIFLINS